MMSAGVHAKTVRAMKALDKAGGTHLTTALRRGYLAAARIIRDQAKSTTAFKSRTGQAKSSWKTTSSRKPYNHAKIVNTALSKRGVPYALFLERKPLDSKFMSRAAESTGGRQLEAVGVAVRKFLRKLRSD